MKLLIKFKHSHHTSPQKSAFHVLLFPHWHVNLLFQEVTSHHIYMREKMATRTTSHFPLVDNYALFNNKKKKIIKAVAIYRNWWCSTFGINAGTRTRNKLRKIFAVCGKTLGKRSHNTVFEAAKFGLIERNCLCMHASFYILCLQLLQHAYDSVSNVI